MTAFSTGDPFLDQLLIFILKIGALGLIFYKLESLRPAEPDRRFFNPSFKVELILTYLNDNVLGPVFYIIAIWLTSGFLSAIAPYQAFNEQIQSWPIAFQVIFGALVVDFAVYWRHRLTHMYAWSFHAVHHSATGLSWLTKGRMHPGDILMAVTANAIVLHFAGFDGTGILLTALFIEIIDYWAHSNMNFEFKGIARYLLVSPNYHRWHHAADKAAYDKNFVVAFPFIDILFGTYYFPKGELPKAYGIGASDQKMIREEFLPLMLFPFRRLGKKFRRAYPLKKPSPPADQENR